ncbi:MAG: serine/threonine-protein kinase, partial [Planctomycetota bacterium]
METEATSSESPIDESDALDAATIVGPIEMDASESGLAHPIDERSTQRDRRQFGEYELLEEIARGGMGVVYRARHRRLDRIVALKMILGGRFSGADEVQRFYVEAKAASRLDHPGIVPLYEIGEVNDQPFYAMKFIEGGSLSDHLPEIRKDTRRAVSLLREVAEAVHHAHQRGILHRDLKPANILLDDQDHPLLTDLGLAKQAGEDSGLTQTGALLGTPSYMPPEQAQSGATVTTACDIYSLGAIFYEILTGRPPFVGATPIETVMQVLESSVTPPRETNRGIDQGLELICLKCLSREPSDRYATAAEFADDLDRWLAGRPISVRPPSLFASTRQWIRDNRPLLVTSAVTLAAFVLALPIIFSLLGSLRDPGSLYAGDADDPRPWVFMLSRVPSFVSNIAAALVLLLWPSLGLLVATESRKPSIGRALRRAA